MKRLTFILCLLTSLFVFSGAAYAVPDTFQLYITDKPYTGGDWSAYVAANDRTGGMFELSETPYLFMHVPASVAADTFKFSWWQPTIGSPIYLALGYDGTHDLSATLPWGTVTKIPGEWTVSAWYSNFEEPQPHLTAKFSFAPEPMSCGLFLLGAGALAAARKRKA